MPDGDQNRSYYLGMDAKIYHGVPGVSVTAVPTDIIGNTKDVTLNCETGESDITTRDNMGFRATAPTLSECSADFEMLHRDNDAALTAIRTAWRTKKPIPLAILTDTVEAGGDGPFGEFSVTNCSRNEALEEAITYNVTVKLSKLYGWLPDDAANFVAKATSVNGKFNQVDNDMEVIV